MFRRETQPQHGPSANPDHRAAPGDRSLDDAPEPSATQTASPSVKIDLEGRPSAAFDDVGEGPATLLHDRGRYQILGEHGRGGLGRVQRARDLNLARDVAIKELIARSTVSEIRFIREALITAKLEHPGIVPVHEAGRWPDGTPFYAMKLVAGRPLRDLLDERRSVIERIALLHHVIAVADAIAYAHGRNIIHRDLKPANVIIGDFGETIVIDWGLAKDLSQDTHPLVGDSIVHPNRAADLTSEGSILGTPTYMAPEQARGESVDQRADVFAIGAMLWELCSLHKVPPVDARIRRHLLKRNGIDQDLGTILDKSLAAEPTKRYRDAGELATDLKLFKAGARIAARTYSLPAILVHWFRRHRTLAFSILGLVCLSIGATAFYIRDITLERRRTEIERTVANAQRSVANKERDRAQMSEAALLLDKDPAKARSLLNHMASQSPQMALLRSRANQRAATFSVPLHGSIESLLLASNGELGIVTNIGDFSTITSDGRNFKTHNHEATGPLVRFENTWRYTTQKLGGHTRIASTESHEPETDVGTLATLPTSRFRTIRHELFILEPSGDLHSIARMGPHLVATGISAIGGSADIYMSCSKNHELLITRSDAHTSHARCHTSDGASTLVASNSHYAALSDAHSLLVDGRKILLPESVSAGYELAISESGAVAFADYNKHAWFLRTGASKVEVPSKRNASPLSAAAQGTLLAWGYQDGSVVVLDTANDGTWELIGHSAPVSKLVIDAAHRRIVSGAKSELRVWDLQPKASRTATTLHCSPYHVIDIEGTHSVGLDCNDGSVQTWNVDTGKLEQIHKHDDLACGITGKLGRICSGGWDGKILCTSLDYRRTSVVMRAPGSIRWLVECPSDVCLLTATEDGVVWNVSDRPRELFRHTQTPYHAVLSPNGNVIASAGMRGELILYDITRRRMYSRQDAHDGMITDLRWQGTDLWTTSVDGRINRWRIDGDALRLEATVKEPDAVTSLLPLTNGWALSLAPDVFEMRHNDMSLELRLVVGGAIRSLDASSDGRYVALISNREIIIVDRIRMAIASIAITDAKLECSHFVTPTSLLVCSRSSLLTINISQLSFVEFIYTGVE